MRILGNLLWFILGGIFISLGWLLSGLLLCITIVGIPFGIQCFKAAKLTCFPFGKTVDINFSKHPLANTVWVILFGWEMAFDYVITAILCFITLVGIPFGLQALKMMSLALFPFGAKIRS